MSYHLNETPVGLVNSVNTDYTTANTLYQLAIVTVDGAIYTGNVTTSGNVFTLADAPTTSITVSYYDAAVASIVTGSLLVSSVYTQFGYMKRDISDVPSAAFIQWCNFINLFLWRYLVGIDPKQLTTTTTITDDTTDSGQYLPSDFNHIQPFDCGFYEVDDSGNIKQNPELITAPYSSSNGYYIEDGKVIFTPEDRPNSVTYRLRYIPNEPELDALTDTFFASITGAYMEMLVHDLDKYYSQWDESAGMESLADFRFSRTLDEFARNIKKEPNVYALESSAIGF